MMRLRTLVIAIVALALGTGLGLLLFRVLGHEEPVIVQFGDTAAPGAPIRVYVSGAVRNPGVYGLHSGDRIVEAVEAAGGPSEDADTEAVNFARRLQDEDHLHVPRIGESPPPAAVASTSPQRIDLNRADAALLSGLPGIGSTRAANIIASRQSAGPFKQTDDLVQRKLVTPSVFAQIKDRVQVGP